MLVAEIISRIFFEISLLESNNSDEIKSQLNMNILCSYIFTLFLGLLVIFLFKSFF